MTLIKISYLFLNIFYIVYLFKYIKDYKKVINKHNVIGNITFVFSILLYLTYIFCLFTKDVTTYPIILMASALIFACDEIVKKSLIRK